jgi:predicted metalloprotease with PDZ domain
MPRGISKINDGRCFPWIFSYRNSLSIHSKEIQDFDYNDPKMSEHLWMYEGVTEYFANLFQINQG